jgi:predicted metal-dependent HD superfamily phosphohydrolase
MSNLRTRWKAAWKNAGGSVATEEILFNDLSLRYTEGLRHYHTIAHVEAMLDHLDEFRAANESKMVHFTVVAMATWYHDATYYPYAHNNEIQSARLFALIGKLGYLEESFIQRVVEGILATTHHRSSDSPNIRTLCDLDLAILGQPERAFDRYEGQIRLEYDAVPENEFRTERRKILAQFLERPRIYQTDFFKERYEQQARENLTRSIEHLS